MKAKYVRDANEISLAHLLLDKTIEKMQLKNDAALCRLLEVRAPVISKIRHGKLPVGDTMIIRIHEVTGLSIREIKGELKRRCL